MMRTRRVGVGTVLAFVLSLAAVGLTTSLVDAAPPLPHPSLVPEIPARGYPIILGTPQYVETNENCFQCVLSREVLAADQAGQFIVSGGNFFEVELQNGTVLQQKYFAAWNVDTKQIACANQFNFNGVVRAVEPGPTPTTVFVGGEFTKVSGADGVLRTRNKVALIDLATCSVNINFASTGANGRINEIVAVGSRVFVGGDFTSIGGVAVRYVAELNGTTGATQPAFNLTFGNTTLAGKIRGMGASPDGSTLIFGGRFGTVSRGGLTLSTQTAVVNISNAANPLLTTHRFVQTHPEFTGRPLGQSMQDVTVSPDGTKIGIAYGTATVSDFVYLVSTGAGTQSAIWRHAMGDSSFGMAISNNAVYVSGHFCKIDGGPGATQVMSPKMGLNDCTGSRPGGTGTAWRTHMAALSLTDGTPLTWNPGADSFVGGHELTVTSRGLLVGFDGQRVNDIRSGALAFLDFGPGPDAVAPSNVTYLLPVAGATVSSPVSVAGTATDNIGVVKYRVRVLASNGQWVQANGTLGATAFEFKPLPTGNGSFLVGIHMPVGAYEAQSKAVDAAGLSSVAWAKRSFTVANAARVAPADVLSTTIVIPDSLPLGVPLTVSGAITTNRGIAAAAATITDLAGAFVQDDLTLGEAPNDVPVTMTGARPDGTYGWTLNLGSGLPVSTYTIAIDLVDAVGNTATGTATFTVGASVAPQPHPALLTYAGFQTAAADRTVGFAFRVASPTLVHALGIFDGNGNGALNNPSVASVGLWVQATQQLLASTSVAPGTPAELGWFYGALPTAVVLQPGVTYVVGYQSFAAGEPFGSGGAVADMTVVSYLANATVTGGFSYPSQQTADVFGFGLPNMKVSPVPTP